MTGTFNPYLVMMLSQIGAGLDPQGIGGILGRTAQGTMQSMLVAKALQQQQKVNNALLANLLGHLANPQSGLTELSLSDKGITLKGAAPKTQEPSLLRSGQLKDLNNFLNTSADEYLSPFDLID